MRKITKSDEVENDMRRNVESSDPKTALPDATSAGVVYYEWCYFDVYKWALAYEARLKSGSPDEDHGPLPKGWKQSYAAALAWHLVETRMLLHSELHEYECALRKQSDIRLIGDRLTDKDREQLRELDVQEADLRREIRRYNQMIENMSHELAADVAVRDQSGEGKSGIGPKSTIETLRHDLKEADATLGLPDLAMEEDWLG